MYLVSVLYSLYVQGVNSVPLFISAHTFVLCSINNVRVLIHLLFIYLFIHSFIHSIHGKCSFLHSRSPTERKTLSTVGGSYTCELTAIKNKCSGNHLIKHQTMNTKVGLEATFSRILNPGIRCRSVVGELYCRRN